MNGVSLAGDYGSVVPMRLRAFTRRLFSLWFSRTVYFLWLRLVLVQDLTVVSRGVWNRITREVGVWL